MKKTFQRFMSFLARPKSLAVLFVLLILLFSGFIITDNKYSADSAALSGQTNSSSNKDQNFVDKSASEQQQMSNQTVPASAYTRNIIIILFSLVSALTIISLIWSYIHPKDILPVASGSH